MATEFVYVKLIKEWGGFVIGDVIRFGRPKGERVIEWGFGIEVPRQKAVNDRVAKRPEVETAVINPYADPKTETADVTPIKTGKTKKKDMPGKTGDAYKDARNK